MKRAVASLAAAVFLLSSSVASAKVLVVDSFLDAVDLSPGDGRCQTAQGRCSLRAAIQEANALPGGDLILLGAGLHELSLVGADEDEGARGDLDILESVEIRGVEGETVISAALLDRVFDIPMGGQRVVLSRLVISDGASDGDGGGVRALGTSRLVILRSRVSGNSAQGNGGGIMVATGKLHVFRSEVTGNLALREGGGIQASGPLYLWRSDVSENMSPRGGGIALAHDGDAKAVTRITRSRIAGNLSTAGPGEGLLASPTCIVAVSDTVLSPKTD